MMPNATEVRNDNNLRSVAWFAAAVGTSIGVAALAYRRRPRTRWERARDRANDLIETARNEATPWMAATAGAAVAGTALTLYLRKPKVSGWQRAGKRAGEVASQVRTHAGTPWANVAAATAVSLVSMAYANKARQRIIRGVDASTADRINALTEKGLQLLRRFREISEQTGKLYARGRHAIRA